MKPNTMSEVLGKEQIFNVRLCERCDSPLSTYTTDPPLHQFPGTDNACLIKLLATLKIFGMATKLTNRDLERSMQGSH